MLDDEIPDQTKGDHTMILRLILTTVLWFVVGSRLPVASGPGAHHGLIRWLVCGAIVLAVEGCWRMLLARVARPRVRLPRGERKPQPQPQPQPYASDPVGYPDEGDTWGGEPAAPRPRTPRAGEAPRY